jgi:lipoprotein-anchoring transpeptidase ErfK/SrfK
VDNVVTKAAVMSFEALHGLGADGVAGAAVWAMLLADAQTGVVDSAPYDNVVVNTVGVEQAVVYRNGVVAASSLANTGMAGAATAPGTYPVYLRYTSTTMAGTNLDGSHYSDPGIPWVSYFNGGDALHGFVRGSYGWPQSLGCVELPVADAAVIWPMTPIGTLVSVT